MGFARRNQFSQHAMEISPISSKQMEVKPRTKPLPKDNTSLDQSKTQLRTKVTGMNESQEKDTNNAASHIVIKLSQRDQKGSATGSKSSQHAKYVPSKMKTVSKDGDHVQSNLRVKTAISTQSKNNLRVKTASSTQSKNNLRVKAAGSNQVRKKKLGAIFPEPEVEGIDAEDQLNSIDNLLEDRECMWLSSDSLSTKVKAFSKDGSHDQSKSSFKAKAASSNHARKKKSATIFPGLELEGLDAKDQLSFIDKLSDNVECMWLSSDSVSLISSEDSVDASEVDYMNVWMPSISKNSELPLSSNSADIVAYQDNIQNPYSDSDEPLYWPFDQSLYNSVDVGNFLCQPPCKDESNVRDAGIKRSKVSRSRLSGKSLRTNQKDTMKLKTSVSPSQTPKSIMHAYGQKGLSNVATSRPSRNLIKKSSPSTSLQNLQEKRKGLDKR